MNNQAQTATDRIDWWNSRLLIFLAGSSFVLSYAAMYALAQESGITWFLIWLWPLTTEAGVVIFSLALMRARLHGYDNRSLYWLILICTGLSVAFNVSHAPPDLVKRAVFALPPLFLLLAFKTLLWQVEQDSKRSELISTLSDLQAQQDRATTELHQLRTRLASEQEVLTAELDTLTGQRDRLNAELNELHTRLFSEQDSLADQIDTLTSQRDRLSAELAALREQVSQAQRQVKSLEQARTAGETDRVKAQKPSGSKPVKGRDPEQVRRLKDDEQLTWPEVAERLQASESSVKRWYRLAEPTNGHSEIH